MTELNNERILNYMGYRHYELYQGDYSQRQLVSTASPVVTLPLMLGITHFVVSNGRLSSTGKHLNPILLITCRREHKEMVCDITTGFTFRFDFCIMGVPPMSSSYKRRRREGEVC